MGKKQTTAMRVGLISDTHGLLRPAAVEALQGSDLILHAGDIGKPEVLEELQAIAPVIAVRGNNDNGDWAEAIPERKTIQVGGVGIHLLHILKQLSLASETVDIGVVISGHSHQPLIEQRAGMLFINPGSAGPRRFKLPVSVAHLYIEDATVRAEIVELAV